MLNFFLFPFTQGNPQFISSVRMWHHKFPPELLSPIMWEFSPLGLPSNSYNGLTSPHEESTQQEQTVLPTERARHHTPTGVLLIAVLTISWQGGEQWNVKFLCHHPGKCRTLATKSFRTSFHSARGWELQTVSDCSDLQRDALGKRDSNSAFTRRSCYYPQTASWHSNRQL